MRSRATISSAWCVLTAANSIFAGAPSAGAQSQSRPLSARSERAMEASRTGAVRRLRAPECQKLLTDFTDAHGRSLLEKLEARGLSAADYLQTITFVDGSPTRSCRLGRFVLLVARPGSDSVAVCPTDGDPFGSRLADVQFRNPALAEAIVIHEMLHTLGLGEDPPTSEEITRQVRLRCGS